ncbi:MAG: hypothetical protein Q4C04_04320 [Clostridia bacterium]|nr:hypothetical protein [Clostridia bacterium]
MACCVVDVKVVELIAYRHTVNRYLCFTEREELHTALANRHLPYTHPVEKAEALIEKDFADHEPYWQKCILICVDN